LPKEYAANRWAPLHRDLCAGRRTRVFGQEVSGQEIFELAVQVGIKEQCIKVIAIPVLRGDAASPAVQRDPTKDEGLERVPFGAIRLSNCPFGPAVNELLALRVQFLKAMMDDGSRLRLSSS
jgi:hypothetical protein